LGDTRERYLVVSINVDEDYDIIVHSREELVQLLRNYYIAERQIQKVLKAVQA